MFDEECCAMRDVIRDALFADISSLDSIIRDKYELEVEEMTVQFSDNGLTVEFEDRLYSIAIERV